MRTLLIALLLFSHTVWSATERSILVSADAYVEAVPDTLLITVSVKQTAVSLEEAQKAVAKTVPKVLKLASEYGVAEADIDSSSIQANPEYEYRNQERRYIGQSVTRRVNITLRELDQYGPLVQSLSELQLHNIQGPQTSHSKQDELELAALKKALSLGRQKAAAMAAELDMTLGKVIRVEEGSNISSGPRMMRMEAAMADTSAGGEFSFGKQKIHASVIMSFELK